MICFSSRRTSEHMEHKCLRAETRKLTRCISIIYNNGWYYFTDIMMKKVAGTELQPSTLNSNSISNLLEESARDHQYTQLVIRLMDTSDDHNRRLHSRSRDILRDSGLFTADQSAGVQESESTTANHGIRKSRHRLSRIFSQYVLITFLYRWHNKL